MPNMWTCQSCGHTVHGGMSAPKYCPNCRVRFGGVVSYGTKSGWRSLLTFALAFMGFGFVFGAAAPNKTAVVRVLFGALSLCFFFGALYNSLNNREKNITPL